MIPRVWWRAAAFAAAVALVAAALAPRQELPQQVPHSFGHVVAFALLAALCERGGLAPRSVAGRVLLWVAAAAALETAQGLFTTTRTPSVIDALGSDVGAFLGVLAGRLRHPWALVAMAVATLAVAVAMRPALDALREGVGDWPARRDQRTESTPRLASASARSLPGSPAWPFTQCQLTS